MGVTEYNHLLLSGSLSHFSLYGASCCCRLKDRGVREKKKSEVGKNAQAKCKQEIEYWKWGRYYFLLHHSTFIPNKQVNVAKLYLHFKWYICSSYYYTIDMGSLQNLYIKAQLLATVHPHQWEHVTSNLCICMCVAMADFQSSSLQSISFDCTTDMEGLLHS